MSEHAITEAAFGEIAELVSSARQRAVQAVNSQIIDLYWQVGAIISRKIAAAEWGDGVIPQLAAYLAKTQPGLRGFTRANLFRMRQFYETYRDHPSARGTLEGIPNPPATGSARQSQASPTQIVAALPRQLPALTGGGSAGEAQAEPPDARGQIVVALLRQLPWTHHLIILGQCKRPEEREFYLRMAVREQWSSRELERQLKGALFERTVLHPPKASQVIRRTHAEALSVFKDAYLVEFLDLPAEHAEFDLHRGLLLKLKDFLIELGRDFCFVGSEFPVQVGGRDFALDLLFFHRGLNALVAIELKVGRFEPEYLGKLSFYLEALDRDVKKPHENPAIGVLLCASKDEEVVEYALSRTLSPALIAEYQPQLPDKQLLQAKLHEFYLQNAPEGDGV
jgi:predicted nuclease of restriction endonuclease-like (RecB) superfamily